ncbi:hypothetical protein [Planococcus sp. ISL-109]|uniref:hypothetical protein n=1 Tax=Planococcus sp. ISL-109 TaxID=2819166 RepID=UPI001BEBA594|nr:hypothetical protein [Planococcus sp. ISL-109]MBT2583482.1 hypothetical protein [Planococcus sp. ISL-109]
MDQEKDKTGFGLVASWFPTWVQNNKAVFALIIILLILVNWLAGKRILAYSRKQKS